MAYVIDYTVTAGGETKVVPATDHREAAHKFVIEPPIKWSDHDGTYVPEEGETITVVGPTQEAVSKKQSLEWRLENARKAVAEGGGKTKYRPSIADRRAHLAEVEAEHASFKVETHIVQFQAHPKTVYVMHYVTGLPVDSEPETVGV